MSLRKLRLKAVWLLVIPFFFLAHPTVTLVGVGATLALLGLVVRGWSAGTIHKDEELTVTGPYAHTRNPLYLGSLVLGLGITVAGGHWAWPAAFLVFYLWIYSRTMAHESELLTQVFGERYLEYASNVPGFVPRLTPYRHSAASRDAGFRWSQYRRNREWEAALGAVAGFGVLLVKALLG